MNEDPQPSAPQAAAPATGDETVSISKIQTLLAAKDDTSRFVGLALLKSMLDNSPALRESEETIVSLWESISPKFVDRLIKTASREDASSSKDGKDMLDLAVSVLHIFATLLPDRARRDGRMTGRIPRLVACLLHWYESDP